MSTLIHTDMHIPYYTYLTQVREVRFVSLEIQHHKCVLVETHTQLADGRVRTTLLPIREKLNTGESWEAAARRGLQFELLQPLHIMDTSWIQVRVIYSTS